MDEAAPGRIVVRSVPADTARPLRLDVLRPGRPAQSTVYPGDDDPRTVHFGAFVDDQLVGVASLYAESRADGPQPGWRLRGMATAPAVRGGGVGAALLRACLDHVAAEGGGELWCNARASASGFYERHGFEVVSEWFEIAGIGPHEVMRRLTRSSS